MTHEKRFARLATALVFFALTLCAGASARAGEPRDEQARLAEEIRRRPSDYEATYRYVILSIELRDDEAAIGALERLLMFNPKLSRAQKELGFLYARLGAYQTAILHLRAALAAGDLDPVQTAQIEAQLPDIEKQTQASRFYGRLQVGIRAQSNANFFPANNLFQVGGVGVRSFAPRQSDINSFQLANFAHDYDFQNQRGDTLETRATVYATQQFSLPRYSVALFSGSFGPRLALAPELLPGVTIKPYATGTVALLGDGTDGPIDYFKAAGGGVNLRAPINYYLTLEPGFEWRALYVRPGGLFGGGGLFSSLSTLASGDALTGYLNGVVRATDDISLETRLAYTRSRADLAVQSSDQVDVQALLRLDVAPPYALIGRKWTIAPYARFTHLAFDAANPLLDPFRARRDDVWTYGILLEAPITSNLGLSGHLEFARNDSNLPNFRSHNVSVTFGPTAKF